jgi:DNA helicase-2/ATP-dependent DNA helicase PcrA
MISVDNVRRRAWAQRLELGFSLTELISVNELLTKVEESTGISRQLVPAGDPLLSGAQALLNFDHGFILLDGDRPEDVVSLDAAHEYGHWFLHQGGGENLDCQCSIADLSMFLDELDSLPISKVLGYSSREQRESEANLFAAEFLLPLPLAQHLFTFEKWTAAKIASEIGLPDSVARRQLTDAILLPLPMESKPSAQTLAPLDPSQLAAANAPRGPILVSAGPGTGKTRTLVGRCLYLTQERGVRPESIVALTYSRKAAEEMRERLQLAGVGGVHSGPWVGTFHSFGLELLRKYGELIAVGADFQLLDEIDAVTLLENNLSKLGLIQLTSLRNPAQYLSGILNKIRRAKDELRSPTQFAELVEQMRIATGLSVERIRTSSAKLLKKDEQKIVRLNQDAARVNEVARCYAVYEQLLRENNLLDYSDLIVRSIELLENFPNIRQRLHRVYTHVLADEYQDVNRASARLLKLLASDTAEELWVVGDHRQSIFQFQGASPANVSLFQDEYPTGRIQQLLVNYRSVEEIVKTFTSASRTLSFSQLGPQDIDWFAYRGLSTSNVPSSELAVLETPIDQYSTIKERIELLRENGVMLSQQAILCRKHSQAQEAVANLAKLGVPSLYLGRLLERPEIKDLIAIISVCAGSRSASVSRALQIREYGLTRTEAFDASRILTSDLPDDAVLSPGAHVFALHIAQLKPFVERPSALLRAYLFEYSSFLEFLDGYSGGPFGPLLCKVALRQFIDIVEGFDHRAVAPVEDAPNRCAKLLTYLRRLSAVNSSAALPSSEAISGIDAVQVMTVHSAKGLEFPAVYIPNMNDGQFPAKSPPDSIPDVAGLSLIEKSDADEEDCLFFVALSRARDHLLITRSRHKSSGVETVESPLLQSLGGAIEAGVLYRVEQTTDLSPVEWEDEKNTPPEDPPGALPIFSVTELELYERCPRQYYYEKVAGLGGVSTDDGYRKLHGVVRELTDWAETELADGRISSSIDRLSKLDELWLAKGPVGHTHELVFRKTAEQVAASEPTLSAMETRYMALTAKLRNALVQVRPDKAALTEGSVKMTRRIIGGKSGDDHIHKRLALYRRAAADTFPTLTPSVELHYLEDGVVDIVPESKRFEPARVAKYESLVDGILAKDFSPSPQSTNTCLSCGFLFICPRTERDENA